MYSYVVLLHHALRVASIACEVDDGDKTSTQLLLVLHLLDITLCINLRLKHGYLLGLLPSSKETAAP